MNLNVFDSNIVSVRFRHQPSLDIKKIQLPAIYLIITTSQALSTILLEARTAQSILS